MGDWLDIAVFLSGLAFACWWLDRDRRVVESRPTRADIEQRERSVLS